MDIPQEKMTEIIQSTEPLVWGMVAPLEEKLALSQAISLKRIADSLYTIALDAKCQRAAIEQLQIYGLGSVGMPLPYRVYGKANGRPVAIASFNTAEDAQKFVQYAQHNYGNLSVIDGTIKP